MPSMRTLAGRRIELWVEARGGTPAVNPVMEGLLEELARAGASTVVRVPEHEVIDVDQGDRGRPDLVLLKTVAAVALAAAVADEASGGRFLNSADATWRSHDKAYAAARMAAAGLPVPRTMLATTGTTLTAPPNGTGGWVSKPVYGVHGRAVEMHDRFPAGLGSDGDDPDEPSFVADDGVRLLQPIVGDGPDTKVYVAGGRCFVAAKHFAPESFTSNDIAPASLDDDEIEMVRGVGRALDLACYGVDLRRHDGRLIIVDANPFPGYRGFPHAVPALLAEIERALLERSS